METVEAVARAQLEAERVSLRRQLTELLGSGEGDEPAFDEGFADSSQVAAEQGEVRALAANLQSLLDDVERALRKLDDGTYGSCEVCGEAIAPARLEAMPASRYCVQHA
jgi:RNA polymerase-binding transcription factor DksA